MGYFLNSHTKYLRPTQIQGIRSRNLLGFRVINFTHLEFLFYIFTSCDIGGV